MVKGLLKTLERVWEYDDVSEGVLMSLTVGFQLSSYLFIGRLITMLVG